MGMSLLTAYAHGIKFVGSYTISALRLPLLGYKSWGFTGFFHRSTCTYPVSRISYVWSGLYVPEIFCTMQVGKSEVTNKSYSSFCAVSEGGITRM
jgi:hypothetical protein